MAPRIIAQSCCTTPAAMCYWVAAFVLVYGASLLMASVWPMLGPYGDTLILAALGSACFINFGRNRTLHCGITGPMFLVGAGAAALIESGRWAADLSVVWGVVLFGVGIAFIIEWRTVGQGGASNARGTR